MKRVLCSLLLISISMAPVASQSLQWANKVLDFSSQLTPGQYSASQVLDKPNVLPAGGENPNAWVPDKPHRKEFLKVGFAKPTQIKQIAIAESYNPSALDRILAYDEAGGEHEIMKLNPKASPQKGRMLNVFFEQTPYKVAAVKLEFDGSSLPDYYGIDAIGITDSDYPVIADIPESTLLASGIIVEALDKNVNSEYIELNPLLSPDGKTLYFSRRNHPENIGGTSDKEDIWYSQLGDDGKWTLSRNMGSQVNNPSPNFLNAITTATPDGKSVIFILGNKYEGGKKMHAGVSISSNISGTWSNPRPLNITNDYNFNENANYFLANNRKTLLMSVERDDTRGDRDIYVSFMEDDSVWTEPLNLGSTINTFALESSPFLAIDDKTLYFSSKGFSGFGGSDIYVSKRLDDTWTSWTEPENLGPTINSPQEDLFFNIPISGDYAYFSRGVSETNVDILRVGLPIIKETDPWVTVSGKLIDSKTGEGLTARIVYQRLPDGKDLGIAQSESSTGNFLLRLPGGYLYSIRAEAKDYISENQTLDLRNIEVHKDITLSPIQLVHIEEKAVIRLNLIYFDFAKAILKPASFPELERVVKLMKERPFMSIEVSGHTDNVGSNEMNQKLSEQRASAVKTFLVTKGIDESRISSVGYGETMPIRSNDVEEGGREINRRVEFKILKLEEKESN